MVVVVVFVLVMAVLVVVVDLAAEEHPAELRCTRRRLGRCGDQKRPCSRASWRRHAAAAGPGNPALLCHRPTRVRARECARERARAPHGADVLEERRHQGSGAAGRAPRTAAAREDGTKKKKKREEKKEEEGGVNSPAKGPAKSDGARASAKKDARPLAVVVVVVVLPLPPLPPPPTPPTPPPPPPLLLPLLLLHSVAPLMRPVRGR